MSILDGWIPFSEAMPNPSYDRKNPNRPTHGAILVTNAVDATDRWGNASHVWLVNMVHPHAEEYRFNGTVLAEAGEITAFSEPGDLPLRSLTHWRPAIPEEWEIVDGRPVCCCHFPEAELASYEAAILKASKP